MDPNAALNAARDIACEIEKPHTDDEGRTFRDLTAEAESLAHQFLALDQWLTRGGFHPAEWGGEPYNDPERDEHG